MKLMKRSGKYVASNVMFDPKTISASSYDWWTFVRVIKGEVIFNSYRYSNSTAKHQYKVRSLMRDLGIKIDREVKVRESLFTIESLKDLNVKIKEQQARDLARAEMLRVKRNERAKQRRIEMKAKQQSAQVPVLRLVGA